MANLNRMLELLDEVNITNRVGMKHDLSRERYVITKPTVSSFHEFNDELSRFLQYQLCATLGTSTTPQYMASSQAIEIVERAFSSIGLHGAFEIASTGVRGGLRHVIDVLYETIKRQEEESYISWVLRTECDPLSFQDRTALMQQYLNRFRYSLPHGTRIPSALELAGNYEAVIRMHVEVLNAIRMGIRRG